MLDVRARIMLGTIAALAAGSVRAELASYYCGEDVTQFTARTGATLATQPYVNIGTVTGAYTSGSVTFQGAEGSTLNFGNWSSAIPLDAVGPDLAPNGNENFDITLSAPVYSLGLEYDRNSGLESNYFEVSFYLDNQGVPVGIDHQWRARPVYQIAAGLHLPETQHCFGWWSDRPFDRVTIREIDPNSSNEYFGRIFTGTQPPPPKLTRPGSGSRFGWSLRTGSHSRGGFAGAGGGFLPYRWPRTIADAGQPPIHPGAEH